MIDHPDDFPDRYGSFLVGEDKDAVVVYDDDNAKDEWVWSDSFVYLGENLR